jgi:hypothetical protein
VDDALNASLKFEPIFDHRSLRSVARPCFAKNRMRYPANQVNVSSGVPWRYELICCWNVL